VRGGPALVLRRLLPILALAQGLAAVPLRAGPNPSFSALDVFSLEVAADPQISPDGSKVAYVRRSADIMTDRFESAIWVIDTGSASEAPLVAGAGNRSQPKWSHDGRKLAYLLADRGSSAQLFVHSFADGTETRIASFAEAPANVAWSPDDRFLAFTAFIPADPPKLHGLPARPAGAHWAQPLETYDRVTYRTDEDGYLKAGYVHIFISPAAGGPPRQLTSGPFNDAGSLCWTLDGQRILFSANRKPDWEYGGNESEIYSAGVATGTVRALTSRNGADEQPVVSPDGRLVAFTGFDDKDGQDYHLSRLYVMNLAGGAPRALTSGFDRSVSDPVWSGDSRSIYVTYDDQAVRRIARFDLGGSRAELMSGLAGQLLDRPYIGGSFSLAQDGAIAATTGNSSHPADVTLVKDGAPRQLTHLNARLHSRALGQVVPIEARAPDGVRVQAWLTLPPAYRRGRQLPLILEIHGGPRNAYGPYFSFDDQLYAAAGYAVLSANPRGSTSYGEAFGNLIFHAFPGKDFDDLMAAVDAAVANGYVEPRRLFVTGGSAGGLLTAWTIGKTNRFRAAAVQKPIINMASFVLTADQPDYYARYWFGKMPWEDPGSYWERSPLSLAGQIRTPALIIVGDQDHRTPPSEAEQLYAALKLRGVSTRLIRVPGANHAGLAARPSQAVARVAAIVDWFGQFDH